MCFSMTCPLTLQDWITSCLLTSNGSVPHPVTLQDSVSCLLTSHNSVSCPLMLQDHMPCPVTLQNGMMSCTLTSQGSMSCNLRSKDSLMSCSVADWSSPWLLHKCSLNCQQTFMLVFPFFWVPGARTGISDLNNLYPLKKHCLKSVKYHFQGNVIVLQNYPPLMLPTWLEWGAIVGWGKL